MNQDQDYAIHQALMMVVQMLYPGGAEEFRNNHGLLEVVPTKVPTILVSVEKGLEFLVDAFNKTLQGVAVVEGINGSDLNFIPDGLDPSTVSEEIKESVKELSESLGDTQMKQYLNPIGITISPLALQIVIGFDCDEQQVELFKKSFSKISGLRRFYLTYNRECIKVPLGATPQGTLPSQSKVVKLEQPTRETVIKPDDITDVKIALETSEDVNDFLKKI